MNHPSNLQLHALRDAVYHRYKVDPALQRPASELVELRAERFKEIGASGLDGRDDVELIRHWAVADLIAAQDARDASRDRIRDAIFANALGNSAYAATIASHTPELLRRKGNGRSPSIVDLSIPSTIDSRLAAFGYRMEPSLSSLDSEDDGDALVDMATDESIDPPTEELRELAVAWSAEHEALAPAREAIAVIARNHDRLLRAIDGVVPREQLRSMVVEDALAMRTVALPDQRNIAATSIAESAAAHPGYAESLVEIDEMAAREVAVAGHARKQAEADFLLVQVERRRELLEGGDAVALTASAHADAEAVMRITTDEERLLALVVIGSRAEKLPVYRTALADVNREVAEAAAAARARVHNTFIDKPRDPSADASLASKFRNLTETIATNGEGEDVRPALASSNQAKPAGVQGELDIPSQPSSSDTPVEPSGVEAAEAAAMESIRARHALRREAGAPIDAVGSTEVALLAQADAADLVTITSKEGLRQVAAELEDCLSDPGYSNALDAADLRTGKAMTSLYWDLVSRRRDDERQEAARQRRGTFGVLVEEGHALLDRHDGKGDQLTYYLKYVEDTGRVGTAWGEDLAAMLRVTNAQTGDRIRIRTRSANDGHIAGQSHRILEVVEQGQLVEDDSVVASIQPLNAEATTPQEGAQIDSAAAGNDQSPGAAPSPDESQQSAPAINAQPPADDERTTEHLAARRRRESAAARAAAGLESDALEPSLAKPIEADPAAVRPAPVAPIPKDADGAKVVKQQPTKPTRSSNPMANGVTGEPSDARPVPSEAITKLLESVSYEVKNNGSVLYLVRGKAAFVDHGQQILMHDAGNEEDDAILAAVLLAKEKWGKVEFTGTQAFKQRALELLAKHNLDVQLKNPEQDAKLRQLATAAPAAAATDNSPKPLMGKPRPDSASIRLPTQGVPPAVAPVLPQQSLQSSPASSTARPQAAEDTATTFSADVIPPLAPATLAKDLAPIRAQDWWATQRAAIAYWSKNKGEPAEEEVDLAKLGPEPSAEAVFWFDKGGRRCDPPADAKAFAESLAAHAINLKEMNMANPQQRGNEPPVLLRGVTKDGDGFKTTVLLFKGKGDYLQGFIESGGLKHQVIVHINQRKPEADGVLRPNFLKVAESVGSGADAQWKEIGYGNVVNHRSDGKAVHFDEVLFNVGNEVVAARLTAKVGSEMHKALGFLEARKPRSTLPKTVAAAETADPKQAPAAHALEGAAGVGPSIQQRRSSRTRAAA